MLLGEKSVACKRGGVGRPLDFYMGVDTQSKKNCVQSQLRVGSINEGVSWELPLVSARHWVKLI